MRKLIIISLAILLASCNKIDIPDGGMSIDFQGAVTRTVVSNLGDVATNGGFGVYAQMSTTSAATDFVTLLENEKVYKSGDAWVYDNKCYWALDRTFCFLGIFPYVTNQDNIKVTSATHTQDGVKYKGNKINFTLPENADMDLMTATHVRTIDSKSPDYRAVPLNLNHQLSKININISKHEDNDNNRVDITTIEITGVWKTGILNTAFSDDYSTNWDYSGATTTSVRKNSTWTLDGNTAILSDLLLIPQEIGAQRIPIYISYKFYNVDEELQSSPTVTAYIPIGNWEPSKNYTYNITLAPEDLEVRIATPVVESWGQYQSGGTIVIQ